MTPSFAAAVEQHFITQMTASDPAVNLYFENTPPISDVTAAAAEIFIIPGDTFQTCIDEDAKSRNVGIVHINVFVPNDQGAGEARNIAHRAGKAFRRLNLVVAGEGAAAFRDPTPKSRGPHRGMYKYVVTIPYRYDFAPL